MKRIAKAVVNCKVTAYVKLNKLAIRVKNNLSKNIADFPGITEALDKLDTDLALYSIQVGMAKGNTTITKQRNSQAVIILADLHSLADLVNAIAKGDVVIIALSGFDNSLDPSPHAIPVKVIIKRIVNGVSNLTAKIFIESMGQRNLTYNVRITTVTNAPIDDPGWVQVLQTTSSKKLIVPNLIRGQEIFVQINALNAAGTGLWSETMPFILQ
jgi:hypothetical protein